MGNEWNYKPTNDHYKTGTELIDILIETRAKGGSYLLNVGPDQWGNINEGQMGLLMEIGSLEFCKPRGYSKREILDNSK